LQIQPQEVSTHTIKLSIDVSEVGDTIAYFSETTYIVVAF
jgi:hypothetical protein